LLNKVDYLEVLQVSACCKVVGSAWQWFVLSFIDSALALSEQHTTADGI